MFPYCPRTSLESNLRSVGIYSRSHAPPSSVRAATLRRAARASAVRQATHRPPRRRSCTVELYAGQPHRASASPHLMPGHMVIPLSEQAFQQLLSLENLLLPLIQVQVRIGVMVYILGISLSPRYCLSSILFRVSKWSYHIYCCILFR